MRQVGHEWETGGSTKRKYLAVRRTLYGNLNDYVRQWFCTARSKNRGQSLVPETVLTPAITVGQSSNLVRMGA